MTAAGGVQRTSLRSGTSFICGPAKGTEAKPYRCICCRVAYDDLEQMAVSICWRCMGWRCMGGNTACARCRKRGIFVSDFRVGGYRKYKDTLHYYQNGGLGHRLRRLTRSQGIMNCGKRIPREHFGGGAAVVKPCAFCWPNGVGY